MKNLVTKEIAKLIPLGECACNEKFLIYSTTIVESPHLVLEIGRIRKLAFEAVGVKISSPIDLDEFDTNNPQQSQMFIWDRENQAIVGGYRYSYNDEIKPYVSPMTKAFQFTPNFCKDNWIQLGRSFIALEYQKSRYGIFALMNGLGCLFARTANPMGFFGKVTIPKSYEGNGATDLIVSFCGHYWLTGVQFGVVKSEYERKVSPLSEMVMSHLQMNGDYRELINILDQEYRLPGIPILKIYDSLVKGFKSIHYLGAFVHTDFGGSTEIGMAIAKDNISPKAYKAHIEPYSKGV